MKNILILSIMTCLIFGQSDKIHLPAVKNAIIALESKIAFLEEQLGIVEPKPVPIDSLKIWVDELVAGAEGYFWKTPRTNSIQRVQLALVGDMSGVDYLITNYRTRIYLKQHEYVLNQLNKIKVKS